MTVAGDAGQSDVVRDGATPVFARSEVDSVEDVADADRSWTLIGAGLLYASDGTPAAAPFDVATTEAAYGEAGTSPTVGGPSKATDSVGILLTAPDAASVAAETPAIGTQASDRPAPTIARNEDAESDREVLPSAPESAGGTTVTEGPIHLGADGLATAHDDGGGTGGAAVPPPEPAAASAPVTPRPVTSPMPGDEEEAESGSEPAIEPEPGVREPGPAEELPGPDPDTATPPVDLGEQIPSLPFDPLFAGHGGKLTASLVDSFVLPDSEVAAGITGGFTCTGLDRNFDGSWIVASDGRTARGDTSFEPSIEFLDAGFATSLGHIALAPLYDGIESVQGLCLDPTDGTIWFVDRTNAMIRHISQDGTPLREDDIDVSGILPNGLSYDSDRGGLWVSAEGLPIAYCLSTENGAEIATASIRANADHLFYDSAFDRLYFTYGRNGQDGHIEAVDVQTDMLIGGFQGLKTAQAIEGLYIDGDTFYLANDAGFHDEARPAVNMILKFQVADPNPETVASVAPPVDPDPFAI